MNKEDKILEKLEAISIYLRVILWIVAFVGGATVGRLFM